MIKKYLVSLLNNFFYSKGENVEDKENENTELLSSISNAAFRESYCTFPKYDDENRILKYEYYDVLVKGVSHRNFDISKIELDHPVSFENEPDNTYDENAIKILYDDIFIGYIPKNNLQQMMKSYSNRYYTSNIRFYCIS